LNTKSKTFKVGSLNETLKKSGLHFALNSKLIYTPSQSNLTDGNDMVNLCKKFSYLKIAPTIQINNMASSDYSLNVSQFKSQT
jgi:hypothetical protein